MNLIADTNIWYDISNNNIDIKKIKDLGHKLFVTPTSMLEISSKLFLHTFNERKKVAETVIKYSDDITMDSESHLSEIWGLHNDNPSINWRLGFEIITEATSLKNITEGILDFNKREIRRLNINFANKWREYHWSDFVKDIEDALEPYIPGYKKQRLKRKPKYLSKEKGEIISKAIYSPECQKELLSATFYRALLTKGLSFNTKATEVQIEKAKKELTPYLNAYSKYLINCACHYMPDKNDFGDLECFLYLQNTNRLFTNDIRWKKIGNESCPGFIFTM